MSFIEQARRGSIEYARKGKLEAAFIITLWAIGAGSIGGAAVKGVEKGLDALGFTDSSTSEIVEKFPEGDEEISLIPLAEGQTAYISSI